MTDEHWNRYAERLERKIVLFERAIKDLHAREVILSAENSRLKGVLAELKDALGLVSTERECSQTGNKNG